jgi:hypothetical protein
LYDSDTPTARVLWADCEGVIPTTGRPAAAQTRAASVITRVLPDPAGALITETRLPSVSTDSTAAD